MRKSIVALIFAAGALAGGAAAQADSRTAAAAADAAAFAKVGDVTIGAVEYDRAYAIAQRQKFYHRQVPDHERQALRREVGDTLINRVLLLAEARRRGIAPDRAKIDAQVDGYEKQYAGSEQWPKMKAEVLPALVAELERQSQLEQLEQQARAIGAPTDAQLADFWQRNPQLFTEPPKEKLSIILLKVDPSSTQQVWDSAMEEAKNIRARLAKGADFAETAKLHSGDVSAAQGGDMGWMHKGSMPDELYDRLTALPVKALSEPIAILEGVALFRIDDRMAPQLHPLAKVKQRATQLWQRDQSEAAWNGLIAKLRAAATIEIKDPSRYPDVAATTPPPVR